MPLELDEDYERMLTEQEAARITGLTRSFFQKRRVIGGGPPFRRLGGRAVRYPLKDLVKWMRSFDLLASTSQVPRKRRGKALDLVALKRQEKGKREARSFLFDVAALPSPRR